MKLIKTVSSIQESAMPSARVEIFESGNQYRLDYIHNNGQIAVTEYLPITESLSSIESNCRNWLNNVRVL